MNASMSAVRERRAAPEQAVKADVELLERRALVEGAAVGLRARRVVAAGAVAAPVHRAVVGHAAQALRRHRPLHRVEDRVHGLARDEVEQRLANGPGLSSTASSGLPRSQARLSKSPKTWQLAHDESPWLEVSAAS